MLDYPQISDLARQRVSWKQRISTLHFVAEWSWNPPAGNFHKIRASSHNTNLPAHCFCTSPAPSLMFFSKRKMVVVKIAWKHGTPMKLPPCHHALFAALAPPPVCPPIPLQPRPRITASAAFWVNLWMEVSGTSSFC